MAWRMAEEERAVAGGTAVVVRDGTGRDDGERERELGGGTCDAWGRREEEAHEESVGPIVRLPRHSAKCPLFQGIKRVVL